MAKAKDAPYQINRYPGSEPGTFEFHLVHFETGTLICGAYRERSPIAPSYLRKRQATMNSVAVLDGQLQAMPGYRELVNKILS